MALMSFLHAGWLGNILGFTPTPYYKMPIDLSKAGNIAKTDIRIDKKYSVEVALRYDFRLQQDQFSRDKFKRIVEKYFRPTNGNFPVFPIKLTVINYDKTGENTMVNKIYYTDSWTSTSNRLIDEFNLKNGKYHFKIETVEDYPELADLAVVVEIDYIQAK